MVTKHPHVKLDWKVPEPIKAGSEVLRGVLVISAKELSESEMRKVASQNIQAATTGPASRESGSTIMKNVINVLMHHKRDRMVRIEHIEIDLTGVEVLSTKDLKLVQDSNSAPPAPSPRRSPPPATFAPSSTTVSASSTASSLSSTDTVNSRRDLASATAAAPSTPSTSGPISDSFLPGCIVPGTQQGIPFHMRVPEKVGGTFKSAHASLSYQLTANVHIRRGKEVFVLQHHIPVSLFELVQIRTATKIASPHDLNPHPTVGSSSSTPSTTTSLSSTTSCSSASSEGKRTSGVRFVIPKSNSVLGTAAVKPYSLWGLGPVIASSSQSKYPSRYPGGRGHGQQQQHGQRPRTGSLSSATGSGPSSPYSPTSPIGPITRSYSAMTPQQLLHQSEDRDRYSAMITGKNTHLQEEEMLSVTDQYRRFRRQQQREEQQLQLQQHLYQHHSSLPRHAPLRENMDSVDEVGFGAHIDKSVAAAGDNITLDMFVVKSDVMKVVDIKVSLVETTQVYSLVNNEHEGHGAPYPMSTRTAAEKAGQDAPRRRLIETHVNKIARDYVPAQAEENHANDNHLKGYYEDYENFRTARSLTMYKLGMRIPESALTIPDRELFTVEYMFVIKFFFKDRIGAFLELPIEIVSQYNHNRISTISGAISCVSNSVQIALPPIPILVKRSESYSSDLDTSGGGGGGGGEKSAISQDAQSTGTKPRRKRSKDNHSVDNTTAFHARGGCDQKTPKVKDFKAPRKRASFSVVPIRTSSLQPPPNPGREPNVQDLAGRRLDAQGYSSQVERPATAQYQETQEIQGKTATSTQEADSCIKASSHVPRSELDAIDSRDMESKPDSQSRTTEDLQVVDGPSPLTRSRSTRAHPGTLPKIVIENVRPTFALTGSNDGSPTFTTSPASTFSTASPSPALPLLFDLTSAALPTSAPSPRSTSPTMSPCTRGRSSGDNTSTRSTSMASPAVKEPSGACSSTNPTGHPPPPYPRFHQRQSSSASRDDDSTHSNNGLVAKLAKSLSSPLLRSRASSSSSPTGSPLSLLNSPQQQSSAFTLAATTLSALTMLSSVGHAAVGHEGNQGRAGSSSMQRHKVQHSPPRPLKSCLKKSSAGFPPGDATMIAAASVKSDGTAVLSTPQGGTLKKKVSFATGSTPLPSPTGSQISLVGLGAVESSYATSFTTSNYNLQFSTPPSPSSGGNAVTDQNGGKLSRLATAAPVSPVSNSSHSPTIQSPASASPRSRFHHPFDSHPSRLSPLEKQHLDHQIQDLNVPHSQTGSDGEDEEEDSIDEDEDEDEDYEGDFEDDDDVERESEEQRIERRRLARVAWLAKYGDAFKQVYGAVPELPPI
ncbi:hypothetical protein BGZ67_007354 [Mortierella alpina]|nr:hypothetical protein BGZ67_007354 [Mortierella alpina]